MISCLLVEENWLQKKVDNIKDFSKILKDFFNIFKDPIIAILTLKF